ncbi:hypothetical protein KHA90_24235 [Flavobacterium psychroterrae]|uniref:Uncharacterized protein n=1 Tax=Flavobacterium psychroterrae TaxID=2133767 RepID=A0ABS5PJ00_9FLAO|nr:hypothetical protein [Flavobacterium psychroterrae]MBS7234116.1 hypothetical protein [Flavobacterium psychroterrae]
MYNQLHKNLDYLKEFLEVNNLGQNFTCNFNFENAETEIDIDCEALILFDTSKYEIKILLSCRLDNESVPTSFSSKADEFDVEYGILSIYGKHPITGLYKAVITPYENIII